MKRIGRSNGGQDHSARHLRAGRGAKATSVQSKPNLDPKASAALRERLTVELKDVNSAEEAANWAHRILGDKNSLTPADAACIEGAFRAKLATFATDTADGSEIPPETVRPQTQRRSDPSKKRQRSSVIDKSVLPLSEPRRVRGHHREVHRSGDEATWWDQAGINPILNARALWLRTHPLVINSNISASDANCSMAQKANKIANG
jgi:hypothetical protein